MRIRLFLSSLAVFSTMFAEAQSSEPEHSKPELSSSDKSYSCFNLPFFARFEQGAETDLIEMIKLGGERIALGSNGRTLVSNFESVLEYPLKHAHMNAEAARKAVEAYCNGKGIPDAETIVAITASPAKEAIAGVESSGAPSPGAQ